MKSCPVSSTQEPPTSSDTRVRYPARFSKGLHRFWADAYLAKIWKGWQIGMKSDEMHTLRLLDQDVHAAKRTFQWACMFASESADSVRVQ